MTPKHSNKRKKADKLDLIKIKSFHASKDTKNREVNPKNRRKDLIRN